MEKEIKLENLIKDNNILDSGYKKNSNMSIKYS